ncbi:hypothetical protein CSQ95_08755 [Janthinobacterium sp. BJB304]|nr:hypothetical protein CSQ95_08755 [Janthinobacterium sp. BJB304]
MTVIHAHRAPDPAPVDEPMPAPEPQEAPGHHPGPVHPVPQDDPVPHPHPNLVKKGCFRWQLSRKSTHAKSAENRSTMNSITPRARTWPGLRACTTTAC